MPGNNTTAFELQQPFDMVSPLYWQWMVGRLGKFVNTIVIMQKNFCIMAQQRISKQNTGKNAMSMVK
jgi:hypothetical protein